MGSVYSTALTILIVNADGGYLPLDLAATYVAGGNSSHALPRNST